MFGYSAGNDLLQVFIYGDIIIPEFDSFFKHTSPAGSVYALIVKREPAAGVAHVAQTTERVASTRPFHNPGHGACINFYSILFIYSYVFRCCFMHREARTALQ